MLEGPAPFRTAEEPWGRPGLTKKQAAQFALGTSLLITTLLLAHAIWKAGGSFLIEHPAALPKHDLLKAASIWRLDFVHHLLADDNVAFHIALQGKFGATCPKPTGLLAGRLPSLDHELRRWSTFECPKDVSIGRDQSRCSQNASFKGHPPFLCRAFAHAFMDSCASPPWSGEVDSVSSYWIQMVMPVDVYWEWVQTSGTKDL